MENLLNEPISVGAIVGNPWGILAVYCSFLFLLRNKISNFYICKDDDLMGKGVGWAYALNPIFMYGVIKWCAYRHGTEALIDNAQWIIPLAIMAFLFSFVTIIFSVGSFLVLSVLGLFCIYGENISSVFVGIGHFLKTIMKAIL